MKVEVAVPGLPVPSNCPYGLCVREATLNSTALKAKLTDFTWLVIVGTADAKRYV